VCKCILGFKIGINYHYSIKFLFILVIPTTVIGIAVILFSNIIVDFFIVFIPCPSDPIKLYDLQLKPDLLI